MLFLGFVTINSVSHSDFYDIRSSCTLLKFLQETYHFLGDQ